MWPSQSLNRVPLFYVVSILLTGFLVLIASNSAKGEPLVISGMNGVVINSKQFTNPQGNCIRISNSTNITIQNSVIANCGGEGIMIENSTNVAILASQIEEVRTGVLAVTSTAIRVENNTFKNVKGPFPRGQFVQFNNVRSGGNRINFNRGVNVRGQSNPEDMISIYQSCGTALDPIQVIGNTLEGGGPSKSGAGITTGDNGGCYIRVKDNILTNPGNVGIAIAGGTFIEVLHNTVYSLQTDVSNVGIYVWNQASPECHSHTVRDNMVNWTNKEGKRNPAWNHGNCGTVQGWESNQWNSTIFLKIE